MPHLPTPIDERLMEFDAAGRATLLAGRERESGRIVFPAPGGDGFDTMALPREGSLWSWTVQRFRPKSPPYAGPDVFEPYAVGYVALGDVIILEARLTGGPVDAYRIGMPMTLVAEPFQLLGGTLRTTFAFAPLDKPL